MGNTLIIEEQFQRLFFAAGTKTQAALASVLGISQSSISEAKSRGRIPAEWLLTLFRLKRINPDWIITGEGTVVIHDAEPPEAEMRGLPDPVEVRRFLRLVPFPLMLREINRRYEQAVGEKNHYGIQA